MKSKENWKYCRMVRPNLLCKYALLRKNIYAEIIFYSISNKVVNLKLELSKLIFPFLKISNQYMYFAKTEKKIDL